MGAGSAVSAVRRTLVALALGVGLLAGSSAGAATIDLGASELGGGSLVVHDLGAGVLAFDPAFPSSAAMRLVVALEPGEAAEPIAWNALVDNLSGELWSAFSIVLEGARWELVGSARANAGAVSTIDSGATGATIHFAPPGEPAGLDLGAAAGPGIDWLIALDDPAATSFVMVLGPGTVPDPGPALLLALGLALSARLGARRAA